MGFALPFAELLLVFRVHRWVEDEYITRRLKESDNSNEKKISTFRNKLVD